MKNSKKRAVRMSYSSERTVTQVAESLGISSNMLYQWRKKYTPDGEKSGGLLRTAPEVNAVICYRFMEKQNRFFC